MYEVIQHIAWLYDDQEILDAARNFRIPYWDWAKNPGKGNSVLPESVMTESVIVPGPDGVQVISNPLFTYKFPDGVISTFPTYPVSLLSFQNPNITKKLYRAPISPRQLDSLIHQLQRQFQITPKLQQLLMLSLVMPEIGYTTSSLAHIITANLATKHGMTVLNQASPREISVLSVTTR